MIKEVVWLKKAKTDFNDVVNYLKENWGNKSAEKFADNDRSTG